MSRVISQAVAPSGIACSPTGSVGSEPRSSHPGALVSLIAALASLGGGFSLWAVPPALLLGALGLFHAAPAQAQTVIWSTTLTVDLDEDDPRFRGCDSITAVQGDCSSQLADDDFVYKGVTYRVRQLLDIGKDSGQVVLRLYQAAGSNLVGLKLQLDNTTLPVGTFSRSGGEAHYWTGFTLDWRQGQQVTVKLVKPTWPAGTRFQHKNQIWATTMSAKNLEPRRGGTNSSGCRASVSGGTCLLAMGTNRFTYAGNTYAINDFYHRAGTLTAVLNAGSAAAINAARSLMLIVKHPQGAELRFPLRDLTASGLSATASWPVDDMRWGSYGYPHPTAENNNHAVWAADYAVTLAVVEVPEPVTVTVTSPAARTHTVTVSVPTAVTRQTTISLASYGRVGHRVKTHLRDPDLVSHCDPMDPWAPVFRNDDRKYPYAYIQAGQRSTTFNLCILEVPEDVANQTLREEVTVYLPRGRSSVTYDINVGSAYGGGSGTAEFEGGEGPGSGGEEERGLLTAGFEEVPEEHDGTEFAFLVRLSETVGRFSRSPRASSFAVTRGRVTGVEQVGAGLWRVTVQPASSSGVVTVTLAGARDCDHEPSGAVCAPDGRALSNTSSARVAADPQQQQAVSATPEPADVRVVPGDGSLTVSWTAVAHPRVAAEQVQHALRWSQEAGVWANPSGNNGVAVEAGVNGYTITGLRNGVATGVFVRAFVGRLRSERSEHSSGWVRVKGERTTPRAAAQTVTVAFGNVPPEHDGRTAFALDVQSGSKPAVEAFTVTNGKVAGVESLDPVLWRVRVKPKSWKDVTVALGGASATVRGPARIRVADAKGREGKDASLDFAVTLHRAAAGPVSVDYATEDGTATAGADYTAVSGTLTFAAGETTKTVSVTLLDDAVDEGKETFKLKLSNPQGAYLRAMHREAKGVIRNADPLPSAWQIRFGRSVSQQVVDALQQRFSTTTTPSGLQLTVAGETLTSDTPLEENHVLLSRLLGFESVSSQEVAQGSSFSFSPEGAGPRLSFWGKGALSSFNGVEESTTLTGDVTTALLGAEWNNERWRAGAALSHSWGNGSYQGEGDGADGRISSTLTGIFPYGRYALTPRLGVWATAGYGWGSLSLNPDGDAPEYNPATTMTLGAVGMDGLLLDGGSEGVTLTTTADALFLKTTSEAVVGLASSEGNISRLRLGLEATRPFTLSNGASLSPSLEVGLRQDSGDAETGFGMDLGAGLSWSAPQQGITAAVKGRTLLSHGAEDFQDQGLALSFSWQPSPSNRGASLSLSHAVGLPADGGMAALLNPTAIELPDDANSDGERFEARLAYGFPFYNNRLTLTPSVATALSSNSRSYSLLWSVVPYGEQLLGEPWELSLEGERQEHSSSTVDHSLKLLFSLPL